MIVLVKIESRLLETLNFIALNINFTPSKNWVDITFVYKLVLKIAIFCALRALHFYCRN